MANTTLVDIILEGFKRVIGWVASELQAGLKSGYQKLADALFGTPTPETDSGFVFGEPTNSPWQSIHEAVVGGEIMLVALVLLFLAVEFRLVSRIVNLGSAEGLRRSRYSALTGAALVVSWYWVAVLSLYLVDGLTLALIPGLSELTDTMESFLRASVSNPILSLTLALLGGFAMWVLQAIYFLREILLYVYLYGMPLAVAVGFGGIPVASRISFRLAKQFVPLAILPLPAAVLFRAYELVFVGTDAVAPTTPFLQVLIATSLPVIAVYVTLKTFRYGAPLATRVASRTARGAVVLGTVGAAVYAGNARAARTAMVWGPKAGAGQAAVERAVDRGGSSSGQVGPGTDEEGRPAYRRTENEPSARDTGGRAAS